jgi:hypothetical protein
METIHKPCINEPGNRFCASFHQYPLQTTGCQTIENVTGIEARRTPLKSHNVTPMCGLRCIIALNDDNRRHAVMKQALVSGQFAATVNDHARRAWACDLTHGKTWIVILNGSNSNDNRVNESATSVEVRKSLRSGNVARISTRGGNTSIKRLTDLRQNEASLG